MKKKIYPCVLGFWIVSTANVSSFSYDGLWELSNMVKRVSSCVELISLIGIGVHRLRKRELKVPSATKHQSP